MKLLINGEYKDFTTNIDLSKLMEEIGFVNDNFAIAVNRKFVPKNKYGEIILAEADEVEIICPMQGG